MSNLNHFAHFGDRFHALLALDAHPSQVNGGCWGRSRRHPGRRTLTIGPSILDDLDIAAIGPSCTGASFTSHNAPRFGDVRARGSLIAASTVQLWSVVFAGGSFGTHQQNSRCGFELGRQPGGRLDPGNESSGFKKNVTVGSVGRELGRSAVRAASAVRCGPLANQQSDQGSRCTGLVPKSDHKPAGAGCGLPASGSPGREWWRSRLGQVPHPAAPHGGF